MTTRPNIYEYLNFREFCRDMFTYLQQSQKSYTHRKFTLRAGLGAPNAFKRVIDGDYGLPKGTAEKFGKGLGLDAKEKTYFIHLCAANQAKDPKIKDKHERKMRLLRTRHDEVSETTDQYEYLKNWYCVAIRELLQIKDSPQTPEEIAKALYPEISADEVRVAIAVLRRLELIEEKEGRYTTTTAPFTTPANVANPAVRQFNYQSLSLALDAMDTLSVDQRQYGTLTMAVCEQDRAEIHEKIRHFQQQLLDEYGKPAGETDHVVHVGFYALPFSKPNGGSF